MAPIRMAPAAKYGDVTEADIQAVKNAPYYYRKNTLKKPLEDDFMYEFKFNNPLPTHKDSADILQFSLEDEKNKVDIVKQVIGDIEKAVAAKDGKAFADLFVENGKLS